MVRANKAPAINEGNPDNWERYKLYIARDQYGQENMYVGMFTRNAGFKYQFGYMYLRYLIQQFPIWGPTVPVSFRNDRSADKREPVDIEQIVFLQFSLFQCSYTDSIPTGARRTAQRGSFRCLSSSWRRRGSRLYLNMDNRSGVTVVFLLVVPYHHGVDRCRWGIISDMREWVRRATGRTVWKTPLSPVLVLFSPTLPPAAVVSAFDPKFTNY
jgi:hypothetical protein